MSEHEGLRSGTAAGAQGEGAGRPEAVNGASPQRETRVVVDRIEVKLELADRDAIVNAIAEMVKRLEGEIKATVQEKVEALRKEIARNAGTHD